jgi:hypothetical protein
MSSRVAVAVILLVAVGTLSMVEACSNSLLDLAPCASAVTYGGSFPSTQCCYIINGWGFACLCQVLQPYANGQMPKYIDPTKVQALPSECKLYIPPGSSCAGKCILLGHFVSFATSRERFEWCCWTCLLVVVLRRVSHVECTSSGLTLELFRWFSGFLPRVNIASGVCLWLPDWHSDEEVLKLLFTFVSCAGYNFN